MVGPRTGELLSYGGAAIVHDNEAEMRFIFPNARVVRVSDGDLGQPVLRLRDHPDLPPGLSWPLKREEWL